MAKRGRPLKPITGFDIDMLYNRFVVGQTYNEIAEKEGTTRQNIQQKIRRVVEKMAD